jgi:hypothetical protein
MGFNTGAERGTVTMHASVRAVVGYNARTAYLGCSDASLACDDQDDL